MPCNEILTALLRYSLRPLLSRKLSNQKKTDGRHICSF